MLDTYIDESSETTINVKQQPNDAADAARLHGEIRDRAISAADDAIIERLGAHNEIKIVTMQHEVKFDVDQRHVRAVFTINEWKYVIEVTDPNDLLRTVKERIAIKIAEEIVNQMSNRRL